MYGGFQAGSQASFLPKNGGMRERWKSKRQTLFVTMEADIVYNVTKKLVHGVPSVGSIASQVGFTLQGALFLAMPSFAM